MKLPLRYYGDPILRKKCAPITEITDEIRKLAADMIETSDHKDGIGLAAPQVGYSIALFVARNYLLNAEGKWTISPEAFVFINPKISLLGESSSTEEEGCLSLPGMKGDVERPLHILIEATDLDGKRFSEEIDGTRGVIEAYNARVRMHENDHLNGVLYIDRMERQKKEEIKPLLQKLKARQRH